MTDFLAAVLAKALLTVLEALIVRLVKHFLTTNARQRRPAAAATLVAA
ncbi:hypothetical protein [Actinomadura sp. HBU206391]|nr:hypothetical protein [Actinomadura sp. HBU206391]MBC6460938.1 hypothetical protein [Actinomadura sp. HBU206391]